jgi:hypothetical protein
VEHEQHNSGMYLCLTLLFEEIGRSKIKGNKISPLFLQAQIVTRNVVLEHTSHLTRAVIAAGLMNGDNQLLVKDEPVGFEVH